MNSKLMPIGSNRRIISFLSSFIMLTLLLEPSLLAQEEPSKQDRYGGTLRLPSYGAPAPLDPFNVTDTISATLLDLVFSKLVRWNMQDGFQGDLAHNWIVSDDGLTYIFYLRPSLQFHDGTPCAAEDVAYSFKLYSNQQISPTYYRYFDQIEKWEAVSDSVFKIKLKKPFSAFLFFLFKIRIIPKHLLFNPKHDLHNFIKHPIGTGPFQFESWDRSGQITFAQNADYYEGRPYLNQIQIVPLEKDQVWPAFLRGEIDMALHISLKNYRDIQNDASFKVFRALSASGYVLIFNFKDPLLQDLKIRQALAHAVNREELIKYLEDDEGVLASGPFHPESWAYNPQVQPTPYHPEKAASFLKQAGFTERAGVLERNGEPLILKITLDQKNEYLYRLAKLIRQQLQEIGIKTEFTFYSDYAELSKEVYERGNFQIYLSVHNSGFEPDVSVEHWHSKTRRTYNMGKYFNPIVENLLNDARKTYDQQKKQVIYHRVHQLIEQDKPALFLYFPYDFFAALKHVEVPEKFFSSVIPFYRFKDIYVNGVNKERRWADGI